MVELLSLSFPILKKNEVGESPRFTVIQIECAHRTKPICSINSGNDREMGWGMGFSLMHVYPPRKSS